MAKRKRSLADIKLGELRKGRKRYLIHSGPVSKGTPLVNGIEESRLPRDCTVCTFSLSGTQAKISGGRMCIVAHHEYDILGYVIL